MKEYEVVCTYLNGCAGAAHPTFEEVEITSTDDYIRALHSKDFDRFVKEVRENGQIVYTFSDTVTYIYEFTEI